VVEAAAEGGRQKPFATTGRATLAAVAAYVLIAFLYFGLRPLVMHGDQYIGIFDDPQIPIWSFAWWLHAIEHAQNPFVSRAIWAPSGLDLVWVNTVPALSLVFAPLTAAIGPVGAYDVAAALLPALSAFTAFLLCRHLTGRFWPSLFGGYLFGFSDYELQHVIGQPQLTAAFVVPLIALAVVRGFDGSISRPRLAVELGLLLGLQLYLATEIALTATIMLAAALLIGVALVPPRRREIVSLLKPIAGAYLIAAVLAIPLLYYALTDLRQAGFQPPEEYTADLADFFVPTHLEALALGWAHAITSRYAGKAHEKGNLIGLPLLVILVLYARSAWRTLRGRFLLVALAVAVYFSLGPELTIGGHQLVPLPTPFGHNTITLPGQRTHYLPLLDNILPIRYALYTALIAGVIAALWLATTRSRVLRWLLPALAVLALVPNPWSGAWATTYSVPAFFTSAAYRSCLTPDENVLPEPIGQGGQATLWQAVDAFRYRLAGGRLQTAAPTLFQHPPGIAQIATGSLPVAGQAALLQSYFAAKHVSAVVVDPRQAAIWAPALDRIAQPVHVGGVILYRVGSAPAGSCP
jgi:hypothetical protein